MDGWFGPMSFQPSNRRDIKGEKNKGLEFLGGIKETFSVFFFLVLKGSTFTTLHF